MTEIEEQPTSPPTALTRASGRLRSSNSSCSAEIRPEDQNEKAIEARECRKKLEELNNQTTSGACRALEGLRFISTISTGNVSSDVVGSKFDMLSIHGYLHRSDFPECIGMENSKQFALELFDALSRRRSLRVTKICKDEFYEYWSQITDPSFDSRLKLFFVMVDKNDDGQLTKDEIEEIIMLSASACKLSRVEDKAEEHAASIMDELDEEGLGYIELWQLKRLLLQEDTYVDHSTTLTESEGLRWEPVVGLNHPGAEPSNKMPSRKKRTNLLYFLEANWKKILILGLWFFGMCALFVWKFNQYKHKAAFNVMGYCLTTAKGAAETLKLNMALVLFPVCRITITWLRSTRLANIVPFDDNINFHKIVGGAIGLGVIVHAGLHLTCDFVKLEQSSETDFKLYLSEFSHHGHKPTYWDLITGWEGVTGIIMVACLLIAFPLASTPSRRSNITLPKPFDRFIGYNAFWYSHHLFIIVYICLFIHGIQVYLVQEWYKKTTWMYLAVPLLLYGGERLFRLIRSHLKSVRILKVGIHSEAVSLQMSKPHRFRYKSGTRFFISSSPGDEYLSIHIRVLGDWTKAVHNEFTKAYVTPVADDTDVTTRHSWQKLLIDGPYGTPTQDFHKYDVILLVGLGIGATAFISILKDLINNFIENEETGKKETLKTTNAYFYWITREQKSFDWFRDVMSEVAELDTRGTLEMHNYLTSVYEEDDARSAMIRVIQKIQHAKNGLDVISCTKVRTHFARPNWKRVISRIGSKHANSRIGVFFCGSASLAIEVKSACDEYNQNQQGTTKFEFHKENF